jgi:hypothetical protein
MTPASYNFNYDEDDYGDDGTNTNTNTEEDTTDTERVPLASQIEKGKTNANNEKQEGANLLDHRDYKNEKSLSASANNTTKNLKEKDDIEEEDKSLDTEDEPLGEMLIAQKRNLGGRSPSNGQDLQSSSGTSKFTSSSSTLHSSQQSLTSGFTPSVFGALVDLQERNADRSEVVMTGTSELPLLVDDSQQNYNNHDSIRWEDEASSHITEQTEESESLLSKIIEESSSGDASSSIITNVKTRANTTAASEYEYGNGNGIITASTTARTSPSITTSHTLETDSHSHHGASVSVSVASSALVLNNSGILTTDDDVLLAGARMDQSSRRLINKKNTTNSSIGTGTTTASDGVSPPKDTDDPLLNGARMDQSFKSLSYCVTRTDLKKNQKNHQQTDSTMSLSQPHASFKDMDDEEYGLLGTTHSQDFASQVTFQVRNTSDSQLVGGRLLKGTTGTNKHSDSKALLRTKQRGGDGYGCCSDVIQSKWDVVALASFALSAILLIVVVIVFELVV